MDKGPRKSIPTCVNGGNGATRSSGRGATFCTKDVVLKYQIAQYGYCSQDIVITVELEG